MQLAMTVGATKIQLIQENALAAMARQQGVEQQQADNSGCEP